MVHPVGEVPVEAMARFTAAEAHLYPMVLMDPAGYQLATSLVGLVATELRRDCADIATVLERRAELIGRLPHLAAEAGFGVGGLSSEDVVDAASALRCRELSGHRMRGVRAP
jgi:hypothetical protein